MAKFNRPDGMRALIIAQNVQTDVCLKGMEPQKEQIEPALLQALIVKATESGLSVNDYVSRLLVLANGYVDEPAFAKGGEETPTPTFTPFELAGDLIGSIDSSVLDSDPDSQPRYTAFGAYLEEENKKEAKRSSILRKVAAQQNITPADWVRRNFPEGRDNQGRKLSEALDTLAAQEDSKPNGLD